MSLSTAHVGSTFWQHADKIHIKPECKIYQSADGYLLRVSPIKFVQVFVSFPSFLLINFN